MSTRSHAQKHAQKLRSNLPRVPGVTRRQFSESTKKSLVAVALELFTEHGYAGTSLDAIVGGADVTKGALYHHFSGKQAIFAAVFEQLEEDACATVRSALQTTKDPWDKSMVGLRAFLEIVQDPAYQRIVIQEGPAVLGYERFREQQERSSFGIVEEMVRLVLEESTHDLSDETVTTFARILFGALTAAGETVTTAADPRAAVAQVETAMTFLVAGLRSLAESGVTLSDHADMVSSGPEGLPED